MDITIAQSDVGVVEEFARTVGRVLPQAGLCVLILAVGYLAARLLAAAVDRVLGRVGFDRAVVRGGVGRVLERTRYDPSDLLAKLVFWLVLLVAAQLAFGVFGQNPVSDLLTGVIAFLPNVFVAVVILVLAAAIAALVREVVQAAVGALAYGPTLAAVASGAVLVVGGFAAASQLRIAPGILNAVFYALLATVAGSAIVAIGGAGIVPLRDRWERVLTRLEQEAPQVREQAREARETRRREAEARAAREREARERAAREQEERQAREREAREQEERLTREREALEREARDREAREREAREREARVAREQEARVAQEQQARAAREREDDVTQYLTEREADAGRDGRALRDAEQTAHLPAQDHDGGATTRLPARPRYTEPTQRIPLDGRRGAGRGDPEADDLTEPLRPLPDPDRGDRGDPGAPGSR